MTHQRLILIATAGSIALLGGAFLFQLAGYPPCKMCLWQRWPHAAAIFIGALCLALKTRMLAWLGAIAATITAAVGFFHAGVEQRWWEGPTTCTSGSTKGLSVDELLESILNAPLVRCDEIAWQLAGLSMAGWNAILSLILALIWVTAASKS
ncbi:disulfide bond formation protein B [Litoreibacter sp.]|nr:disulfide bond formation protein B [Litoreibacter sp.]